MQVSPSFAIRRRFYFMGLMAWNDQARSGNASVTVEKSDVPGARMPLVGAMACLSCETSDVIREETDVTRVSSQVISVASHVTRVSSQVISVASHVISVASYVSAVASHVRTFHTDAARKNTVAAGFI